MNITIRLAKPVDIPDIVDIMTRGIDGYWEGKLSEEYIRKNKASYSDGFKNVITEESTSHYVLQKDDKTVGVTCIKPPQDDDVGDNYYEFYGLSIDSAYGEEDVKEIAMDLILDQIRSFGKTAVSLWVWEENNKAIKLYEKCGFIADGKTKIFEIHDNSFNGIRMKRDL
jgi:ribosomal protein S18 acetylase RimI-like enzyme